MASLADAIRSRIGLPKDENYLTPKTIGMAQAATRNPTSAPRLARNIKNLSPTQKKKTLNFTPPKVSPITRAVASPIGQQATNIAYGLTKTPAANVLLRDGIMNKALKIGTGIDLTDLGDSLEKAVPQENKDSFASTASEVVGSLPYYYAAQKWITGIPAVSKHLGNIASKGKLGKIASAILENYVVADPIVGAARDGLTGAGEEVTYPFLQAPKSIVGGIKYATQKDIPLKERAKGIGISTLGVLSLAPIIGSVAGDDILKEADTLFKQEYGDKNYAKLSQALQDGDKATYVRRLNDTGTLDKVVKERVLRGDISEDQLSQLNKQVNQLLDEADDASTVTKGVRNNLEEVKLYRTDDFNGPRFRGGSMGPGKYYFIDEDATKAVNDLTPERVKITNPLVINDSQEALDKVTRKMIDGDYDTLSAYARANGNDFIVDLGGRIVLEVPQELRKIASDLDLASAIQKEFNVVANGLDNVNRLDYDAVDSLLKRNYDVSETIINKLDTGKVIEGDSFVIQKVGSDDLVVKLANNFEPSKVDVSDVAKEVPEEETALMVRGNVPGRGFNLEDYSGPAKRTSASEGISLRRIKQENKDAIKLAGQQAKQEDVVKKAQQVVDERGGLTPSAAKKLFKRTGVALPIKQVSEGKKVLTTPVQQTDYPGELDSFMKTVESGLEDSQKPIYDEAVERLSKQGRLEEAFEVPLKEMGTVSDIWSKGMQAITNLPVIRRVKGSLESLLKFRFSDTNLDEQAEAVTRTRRAFLGSGELAFTRAKRAAEQVAGRELNDVEVNAIFNRTLRSELDLKEKGILDLPIGKDLLPVEKELYETFNDAHAAVFSYVAMYEKELDSLVKNGTILPEDAINMRLVEPGRAAENIDQYVRTFYNKNLQEFSSDVDPTTAMEVQLSFSTAQKKLTDLEWGQAYVKAHENNQAYEVTRSFTENDLINKAIQGDESSLEEVGRLVKQMRGYELRGSKAYEKTIEMLTNNWKDLKVQSLISERSDIFAKNINDIPENLRANFESMASVARTKNIDPNKLGPLKDAWVRKDIVQDLLDDADTFIKLNDQTLQTMQYYFSMWKAGKVIANPPTWGLNFLTGLFGMQTLAGTTPFNPSNWKHFVQGNEFWGQMRTGDITSKNLEQFAELGGAPKTYIDSEILDVLENATRNIDDGSVPQRLMVGAGLFKDNAEKLGKYYSYLDGYNKYVTYLKKIDDGYSPEDAVRIAERYHLNYELAPKVVRRLSNDPVWGGLIPFAQFPVMFARMFTETAINKPWRLIPFFVAPAVYNQVTMANATPEERQDIERNKPLWMQDNPFVLYLGKDVDENGQVDYKYMDLARIFNVPVDTESGVNFFSGPLSNIGGPFQTVYNLSRGVDSFGNELGGAYGDNPAEYFVRGVSPLPNAIWNVADFIKSLQGTEVRGKIREPMDEFLRAFGISVVRSDQTQTYKNFNAITAEYNETKSKVTRLLSDPDISNKGREKALSQLENAQIKYTKELTDMFGSETNMSPMGAYHAALGFGVSNEKRPQEFKPLAEYVEALEGTISLEELLREYGGSKKKSKKTSIKSPPSVKGPTFNVGKKNYNFKTSGIKPLNPPKVGLKFN